MSISKVWLWVSGEHVRVVFFFWVLVQIFCAPEASDKRKAETRFLVFYGSICELMLHCPSLEPGLALCTDRFCLGLLSTGIPAGTTIVT